MPPSLTSLHLASSRRSTFHKARKGAQRALNWPYPLTAAAAKSSSIHPDHLVYAGFYSTPTNEDPTVTTCFACEVAVGMWEEGEDPVMRHLAATVEAGVECPWATIQSASWEGTGGLGGKDEQSWKKYWGEEGEMHPRGDKMARARKGTFAKGWPHHGAKGVPTADEIASAGWYFLPGATDESSDRCSCCYCNRIVEGWEAGDDPIALHNRKIGVNCPFFLASEASSALAPQPKPVPAAKPKRGKKATTASTASTTKGTTKEATGGRKGKKVVEEIEEEEASEPEKEEEEVIEDADEETEAPVAALKKCIPSSPSSAERTDADASVSVRSRKADIDVEVEVEIEGIIVKDGKKPAASSSNSKSESKKASKVVESEEHNEDDTEPGPLVADESITELAFVANATFEAQPASEEVDLPAATKAKGKGEKACASKAASLASTAKGKRGKKTFPVVEEAQVEEPIQVDVEMEQPQEEKVKEKAPPVKVKAKKSKPASSGASPGGAQTSHFPVCLLAIPPDPRSSLESQPLEISLVSPCGGQSARRSTCSARPCPLSTLTVGEWYDLVGSRVQSALQTEMRELREALERRVEEGRGRLRAMCEEARQREEREERMREEREELRKSTRKAKAAATVGGSMRKVR
ncbi:SPOSA6832_04284, partial [Sporobolomyces salmonicolor]